MSANRATYKVVLLGETDVGKSSFFVRYRDGIFIENLTGTIGLDETEKVVPYYDENVKVEVNIQLWDTAGLERSGRLTNNYYIGSKAIVLMYDVTESSSLNMLRVWLEESRRYCESAKLFLVGNKIDCTAAEVEVPTGTASSFAKKHKINQNHLFELSVKNGKGFLPFLTELAKVLDKTMEPAVRHDKDNFDFDDSQKSSCPC